MRHHPQDLAIAEGQLRDYGTASARPSPTTPIWPNSPPYATSSTGLSGRPRAGQPPAAELAGRIKSLKAAQTIETVAERTGKRRTSAEEPVTARIRRQAAEATSEEASDHEQPGRSR